MPVHNRRHRPGTSTLRRAAGVMTLGLSLVLSTQAGAVTDTPKPGEILDLSRQETLSPDELYRRLDRAQLILIGEQHDNPRHHAVESLLLGELVRPGTAVVFEMLGPDLPLADLGVTSSKQELSTALEAGTGGWDWDSYAPLYRLTLEQGGKLVSGNLSREQINALYQGDETGLPEAETSSRGAISAAVRERLGEEIEQQHCEPVPEERLGPMVDIQLARDARMAAQLKQGADRQPAVLVAGGFHVRKDLGVPQQLDAADSAVVLLVSVRDSGRSLAAGSCSRHRLPITSGLPRPSRRAITAPK
ncbi:ChaN family lipoprotein [Marinobacterium aestuariivivens]|uniref:ChaN family lipoprotein n=1 Tax=Marinobacterium aestuariivivens TaxID=1698799 RepID=A0ABW2A893_9GAMM